MATLSWTDEAQGWLRDNPMAAARTVDGIFESAQVLRKADGNIDILGVFHGALEIERFNL
jgi:hypothetical protein